MEVHVEPKSIFLFWENSSSESRRRFESGRAMNNASTQRAFLLSVRSQAVGGANTGQHLQHKLGNTEQPASKPISALKPDMSQLTSRPVRIHLKPLKRLICVWPGKKTFSS